MSKEIKFVHSDSGAINFGSGKDALSALFTIGAIMETRRLKVDGDNMHYEYATDQAGLKTVLNYSESSLELLLGMIQSLSLLLTTTSIDGYEKELDDAYWLLSGLSALASYLANTNAEIKSDALKAESGQ